MIRYREFGSITNTITVDRQRESPEDVLERVKESNLDPDRATFNNDVAFPMIILCANSPHSAMKCKTFLSFFENDIFISKGKL